MATFKLRHFCRPETLRSIAAHRLVQFLAPYRDYLKSRGLALPTSKSALGLDYDHLALILMEPDDTTPDDLVSDLCLIDDMSTKEAMDALQDEAARRCLALATGSDHSPADIALQICLSNKALLERKHAEQSIMSVRAFESFQAEASPAPRFRAPSNQEVRALEAALDEQFEAKKRGLYARVFEFVRPDGNLFMVRHGDPFKREERIKGKETASISFRPAKHDIVQYIAANGELRINARSKWEKELYRMQFGKHVFGDEGLFKPVAKYTLEPLRQYRAASLNCHDVPGIEWIKLKEIEFVIGGTHNARRIWKADDVFEDMDSRGEKMPLRGPICRAVFEIKFSDAQSPRSLAIRLPRTAVFTRDGDSHYVDQWLKNRGFIIEPILGRAKGAPPKFWLALEVTPGLQAVPAQWLHQLGAEVGDALPYLRLSDKLASSYPHPGGDSWYPPLRVVCHGPDDFVGVGADEEEPIALTKQDILILEVDRPKLNREVARAFGLDFDGTKLEGPSFTVRVGTLRPSAGFSFGAYLTIQSEPDDHLRAVQTIALCENRPFLLFAPTSSLHLSASDLIVRGNQASFIPLIDALALDTTGHWALTEQGQRAVAAFRSVVVPTEDEAGRIAYFPTPTIATWSDLCIRFVDGETVAVSVGEVHRIYHYSQMGMADGRNARADKQWELLGAFARLNGIMTWQSPEAGRKVQKQQELLAKRLKSFFRIDGKPIRLLPGRKGWRTEFAVQADV